MSDLVVKNSGLPTTKQNLNKTIRTHVLDSEELLIHHHHIFSKTGTARAEATYNK